MKVKKIISLILLVAIIITLSGCNNNNTTTKENNSNEESTTNNNTSINSDANSYDKGYLEVSEEDANGLETMSCTRDGNGTDGAEVKLNYTLYYQGEYLQILHSKEQVITEDQDILNEYQNAYINIYKNYENLEYYDTSVVREDNSVTNDTVINYGKLDTDKLLEIEGAEDNIIKNGKVKLDDWLKFAEQFGTKCE